MSLARQAVFLIFALSFGFGPGTALGQKSLPVPARPRCVIVVIANRVAPEDYGRWAPDSLKERLERASLGLMSSRAAAFAGDGAAFAVIGAGAGVAVPGSPLPSDASRVGDYMREIVTASRRTHDTGAAGALGSTVRAGGGITSVVGNASGSSDSNPDALSACLIGADEEGRLSFDSTAVGQVEDPYAGLGQSWPYKRRAIPAALASRAEQIVNGLAGKPGLIVVESGDSSRADNWIWIGKPSAADALRARAFWMPRVLQKLDELLARLEKLAAERHALLTLVTPSPRREADGGRYPGLTLTAVWDGEAPTALTSPSTRRPGLILALDLAPTWLRFLYLVPPPTMTGQAIEKASPDGGEGLEGQSPGRFPRLDAILKLDRRIRDDYAFEKWGLIAYGIAAGAAVTLGCALALQRGAASTFNHLLAFSVLAALAGPAALIIPLATPAPGRWGPGLLAALIWLTLPLAAFRFRRRACRLAFACGAPAAVLLVDLLSGGHLFRDALWGRMPVAGGRLYGMDNTCLGVFLGSGWIALGLFFPSRPNMAVGASLCAAALIGLPFAGANVGGEITAAFAAVYFSAAILGKKGRASIFLAACGLAVTLTLLDLLIDSSRVLAPESHLVHTWRQVLLLPGSGLEMALRKVWQNLVLTASVSVGIVPVAFAIRGLRRGADLSNSPAFVPGLAPALQSLQATMIVAYFVNDTGIVTVGFLALYYLGALAYLRLDSPAGASHKAPAENE